MSDGAASLRDPGQEPTDAGQASKVSTLELFFDLVFVFTITQLTRVLARHPDGQGLLHASVLLVVIWWMYGGYAWLTNVVAPDRIAYQLLLLGGMAGFFVISLAVPSAFGPGGVAFGSAICSWYSSTRACSPAARSASRRPRS